MSRFEPGAYTAGFEALDITHVFGLPGTQNVDLFESLRVSPIRTVLATSELAASFMALGFARASGSPGVLATIPGPGLTYALPGLAEARLDSVPLIQVVVQKPLPPDRAFRHQELRHRDLLEPLVKAMIEVRRGEEFPSALARAWDLAQSGEPGPIVVWVSPGGDGHHPREELGHDSSEARQSTSGLLMDLTSHLLKARHPVLFLGMGCLSSAREVQDLVERLGAPFFTTPSARGVIPESHDLCLDFDFDRGGLPTLNELLGRSDLILALGCKLGHNGTGGFRLRLSPDRLIHVNSDPLTLGANYPTLLSVCDRVETVLEPLISGSSQGASTVEWTAEEITQWRTRIASSTPDGPPEPYFPGVPSGTIRETLGILREELPRDGIVVTDSGLHQILVRRHFKVLAPRGLILPTDFQSMGFGLPAAIGAKFACPQREVIAIIGDGGLAMSGMELLTLAREKLPLKVIVFNDGYLNLIRLQQEADFGYGHAVRLLNPEFGALAEACGVRFASLGSEVRDKLQMALTSPDPWLLELPLHDSKEIRSSRRSAKVKALARRTLGDRILTRAKRILRRE